ncbi:MAG: hypothetical protein KDA84_11550 [Planctomycetaceae bacterium]|nr:hypothetical protein [Planctomycetaceae bacterium]
MMRVFGWVGLLVFAAGCASTKTSNTARTAQEQLLISNSVDQALNKVDFAAFEGAKVYVDEKYLDCVDKNYVVGSIRHRALRSGARLVEKADGADIILEVRSGGVGTNISDMYVGMPELSVPGPFPISLPEVRLLSKQSQTGIAKIGIVAFDAKTRQMLGDGGMTMAQSDDSNWYMLGIGPYQNGTVREEVSNGLKTPPATYRPLPYNVAFDDPRNGTPATPGSGRVQWAGSTDDGSQNPFPVQPANQ